MMEPDYKSQRVTSSIPGLIFELMRRRYKELGYRSLSGYILGLVLYDLWARKPHHLTKQIVNEDNEGMKQAVYREIAESFHGPEKSSSYFEHRLEELASELAKKKG
jgi:hypothetical protein